MVYAVAAYLAVKAARGACVLMTMVASAGLAGKGRGAMTDSTHHHVSPGGFHQGRSGVCEFVQKMYSSSMLDFRCTWYDHTMVNTPGPIRSPKLSTIRLD